MAIIPSEGDGEGERAALLELYSDDYEPDGGREDPPPAGTFPCHECGRPSVICCQECSEDEPWHLCKEHDTDFHTGIVVEDHARVNPEQYFPLQSALHPAIAKEDYQKNYSKNLFCDIDPLTKELIVGRALHEIAEGSVIPKCSPTVLISFTSNSGTGKSFFISSMLNNAPNQPLQGRKCDPLSTTSGVHLFAVTNFVKDGVSAIFFDTEGFKGSRDTHQSIASRGPTPDNVRDCKSAGIRLWPKMLYAHSNIMCYAHANIREGELVEQLRDLASVASSRMVNLGDRPHLVLIVNRANWLDMKNYTYSPEKDQSELDCVERATNEWLQYHKTDAETLLFAFHDIHIVYVPDLKTNLAIGLKQVHVLRTLLQHLGNLDRPREPSTPQTLYPMLKFVSRLHKNPEDSVDMNYYSGEKPTSRQMCGSFIDNLCDYWGQLLQKFADPKLAYEKFLSKVASVFRLRKKRGCLPTTPSVLRELGRIDEYINSCVTCAATCEFICGQRGNFTTRCGLLKKNHRGYHESVEVFKVEVKTDSLKKFWGCNYRDCPCRWNGGYVAGALNNGISLPEYVIPQLDSNRARWTSAEFAEIRNRFSSYCPVCLHHQPKVTLWCGDSVCEDCYEEMLSEENSLCRLCGTEHPGRVVRKLPPGAGPRVLCLDGGGLVKSIVQVKILQYLESALGVSIWNLFDVIIGTNSGAILAAHFLYATFNPGRGITSVYPVSGFLETTSYNVFANASDLRETGRRFVGKLYSRVGSLINRNPVTFPSYDISLLEKTLTGKYPPEPLLGAGMDGPLIGITFATKDLSHSSGRVFCNNYVPGTDTECTVPRAIVRSCSSFPLFKPTDEFVDGGFFANCPTLEAIKLCDYMWEDVPPSVLFSLGTGSDKPQNRSASVISYGMLSVDTIESTADILKETQKLLDERGSSSGQAFFRLDPELGHFFRSDAHTSEDRSLLMRLVGEWIAANSETLDGICATLVASCIIIDTSEYKKSMTSRVSLKVRSRLHEDQPLDDSLWNIASYSFKLNGKPLCLASMTETQNPKTYELQFDVDPTIENYLSVTVRTKFGDAWIASRTILKSTFTYMRSKTIINHRSFLNLTTFNSSFHCLAQFNHLSRGRKQGVGLRQIGSANSANKW